MNALATPFRQLMERKLWPLAIVLVAALAAVPMLLAKDEVPAPPAPIGAGAAVAPATQSAAVTQPIVTLGQAADREASRKVLGARKNPFEPKVKAKKASTTKPGTVAAEPVTVGGKPAGSPTTPSKGTSTPTVKVPKPVTPVTPTTPVQPAKLYDMYGAKIRFGRASDDSLKTRSPLKRLTTLPRVEDPQVVFLGLKRDLKTAVFLLAAGTKVVGEGACLPSRDNCQTVELKAGETEFITVVDSAGATTAQYQLDMVKVIRGVTMDPKVARRWRHSVARDGREGLRANLGRVNNWKYDVKRGVVYRSLSN